MLLCFVLAILASPFKSKLRLEAENAVLRRQLIVLKRRLHGRVPLTNNDRWFFIQLYRWFHGQDQQADREQLKNGPKSARDLPVQRARQEIDARAATGAWPTRPNRARLRRRDWISLKRLLRAYPTIFGQVVLIQFAAAVDSLWVVPGFGQPSGAVMFRIGMVMIRAGSQLANS